MFSDKYVEESTEYGIGNLLVTSLLAAVFLFVGVFVGRYYLFDADYASATQFRAFAYHAIVDGDISLRADGTGAATIEVGGQSRVVNTYASAADKAEFGSNGYGLIIDPAPSVAYDDFTAYCVNKKDGSAVDYQTYRALSDGDKKQYRFAVEYGGRAKTFTAEQTDEYLAFLRDTEAAKKELDEIEENKDAASVDSYRDSVWALYVKYYYPDMFAATGEDVPTLGGYYYGFVTGSDKYLCIFGDMTTVAFVTGAGKRIAIGFAYDGDTAVVADGAASRAARERETDEFFKKGYYGGMQSRVFADFTDQILTIVLAELTVALVVLLCWAVCKRLDVSMYRTFSDSAKAVGSYAHIAALISAVVALLFGFLLSGMMVAIVGMLVFFAVLVARTAVLVVRRYKTEKREEEDAPDGDPH